MCPFNIGTSVFDAGDWDILCILDGCRVDTFKEVSKYESESMLSVASTSQTWIPRTFSRDTESVGYITGNPHATGLNENELAYFHQEPVVDHESGVKTVPPEALTDRALSLWKERDEFGVDQLIIHYMQPHVPFRSRPEWFDRFDEGWGSAAWDDVGDRYSPEEWFEAYRDNLKWVINDVERLIDFCETNQTVALSADHGNAVGEFGVTGHPRNAWTPHVRKVPWATVTGRSVSVDVPDVKLESHEEVDNEEQLEALGYL